MTVAHLKPPTAKDKLLRTAVHMVRAKGYEATTVDELCSVAGVTKGAFFHHFKSKEELGQSAAQAFNDMADGLFASAKYMQIEDPYERLMGYVDFRIALLRGALPDFTCLLGTMVQETYETHPALREACERHISGHAAMVAKLVEAARRKYVPDAEWSAESLAFHTQAVLQGAFVLAKAKGGPAIAIETMNHLKRYIEMLFSRRDLNRK